MIPVIIRQLGRHRQNTLGVVFLMIVVQGCAVALKEKHTERRLARERERPSSTKIEKKSLESEFADSPRRVTETTQSTFSKTDRAQSKRSSKSSLAEGGSDSKTTAASRSESKRLEESVDRSDTREPAWISGFIEPSSSRAINDEYDVTLAQEIEGRRPTTRSTNAFRNAKVTQTNFEDPDFDRDAVDDEVISERRRRQARTKSPRVDDATSLGGLRKSPFRRSDGIVQAQGVVPEPETIEPQNPRLNPQRTARPIHIPLEGDDALKDINVTLKNGRVTLVTRNAPVQSVLNLLAQQQGVNLITSDEVTANISVSLSDVSFEDALSSIVAIAGCNWTEQKGIVLVTKTGTESSSPEVTGKIVQVFPLNYISAADVEATVKGLLSPMGQIFTTQMSATDKRRTQEHLVIEDIPASLERAAQLIAQLDQPPRQVMIQAHVLQVELKDDTRHGINWERVLQASGGDLTLKTVGFANPLASPASFMSFDGKNLDVLVEALKSTTDTKTLASPKIVVANGQEARIQIGQRLGYFVTTTTQTSTLQNVNFLDTGVVMRVTPQISQDNRVLMNVRPEVSSGKISSLGLPETSTTEANTTVLVDNGGGIVIGGLIKESDTDSQDKVPVLGDLWLVGRAFQRRSTARARSEIVIVLIPQIAPYFPDAACDEQFEVDKTQTKLFYGALNREERPWEPRLPDAIHNPRRLRFGRLGGLLENPLYENPKPLRHYFPSSDEECFDEF